MTTNNDKVIVLLERIVAILEKHEPKECKPSRLGKTEHADWYKSGGYDRTYLFWRDFGFSTRTAKALSRPSGGMPIQTLEELVSHTGEQLLRRRNFGVTSLFEVQSKLKDIGIPIKEAGKK